MTIPLKNGKKFSCSSKDKKHTIGKLNATDMDGEWERKRKINGIENDNDF